jgi:hypothetical protein
LDGISTQNHSAAVNDVEDRDGLARFALGVERIAAEIYQIESDAEDQQDRPRVARFGDVTEPVGNGGLVERRIRERSVGFQVGARSLLVEFQNLEWLPKNLTPNSFPSWEGEQSRRGSGA